MTDVAQLAGVSLGTVSNTLNSPDKVSLSTRRRVLAAIAELGFVRNDAARSLAAGRSTTIGLVVADLGNSFFVDIARGAESVMRRNGMNVLIANSDIDPDREARNLEIFEQSRVAGMMLAPLDTPFAQARLTTVRSTPLVLVNYESPGLVYAGVSVDERHGGTLAAEHLIDLGRRRLLFVGGPFVLNAVRQRRDGVAAAVDRAPGVSLDIFETRGVNIRHGRQAASQVIEAGAGAYDGIIAASDLLAIGLIQILSELPGFGVPEDIAVTGYDNNHFASESSIPISTVSQPGDEMGRAAAELLLTHIRDPKTANSTVVLEPHLIARRSTLGNVWRRD